MISFCLDEIHLVPTACLTPTLPPLNLLPFSRITGSEAPQGGPPRPPHPRRAAVPWVRGCITVCQGHEGPIPLPAGFWESVTGHLVFNAWRLNCTMIGVTFHHAMSNAEE